MKMCEQNRMHSFLFSRIPYYMFGAELPRHWTRTWCIVCCCFRFAKYSFIFETHQAASTYDATDVAFVNLQHLQTRHTCSFNIEFIFRHSNLAKKYFKYINVLGPNMYGWNVEPNHYCYLLNFKMRKKKSWFQVGKKWFFSIKCIYEWKISLKEVILERHKKQLKKSKTKVIHVLKVKETHERILPKNSTVVERNEISCAPENTNILHMVNW